MPPRIKYSIPLKPVQGRPIPPPRTRSQMLREQLIRGGVDPETADLIATDIDAPRPVASHQVQSPLPQADPEWAAARVPEGIQQSRLDMTNAEKGVVQPQRGHRNLLDIWFPQLRVEDPRAAIAPPPKVREEREAAWHKPTPLTYKDPETGKMVPSVGPPEGWGTGIRGDMPEESDLLRLQQELEIKPEADTVEGVRFPVVDEGPWADDLANRSVDELYDLTRSKLAPDEFARMRESHNAMRSMGIDEEIKQGIHVEDEIFNDLLHRIRTTKTVSGSPELDVDAILDTSPDPVSPEMRDAVRRIYHEGDPEEFAPQPGGRAQRHVKFDYLDDEADPNDPSAWQIVKKRTQPTVSPMVRKEPLDPGLADDVMAVERQEFLKDTTLTRDDIPVLRQQERDLLKRIKKLKDQDPAARQRLLKELGGVRAGITAAEEEIKGRGAHLDRLRESGFVSPRTTGDFVEGERSGPSMGPTEFPFRHGDQVAFLGDILEVPGRRTGRTIKNRDGQDVPEVEPPQVELRAGNKVLKGEIVHVVPDTRAVASKEEIRAWKLREGKLINADTPMERQAQGPMPTFFNFPQKFETDPRAAVGETVAFPKGKKRDKVAVWEKRTASAPPTVRVRLEDGREVSVRGTALRPINKAGELALQSEVESLRSTLKATQGQQSFDFETGGAREPRLAAEMRAKQAALEKRRNPNYRVVDASMDAEGWVWVQKKGQAAPFRMPLEKARKMGILPEDQPVGVSQKPVVIKDTDGRPLVEEGQVVGVASKRFPGILRPGDTVVYKGQERQITDVRPNHKTKMIEVIFGTGAVAVGGSAAFDPSPEALEGLDDPATAGPNLAAFFARLGRMHRPKGDITLPPHDPKMDAIRTVQEAPVQEVSKIPETLQAYRMGIDRKAILTEGARILEREGNYRLTGGSIDPETAPHNTLQGILEGGGKLTEDVFDDMRRILAPVQDLGAMDAFNRLVNYQGLENAWKLIDEKAKVFRSHEAKAYAVGDDLKARQYGEAARELEDRMAKREVGPEGITPEEIATGKDALLASMDPETAAQVEFAVAHYQGLTRNLLDTARHAGLISQEWFDEYASRGGYIPLNRVMDLYDPASGTRQRTPTDPRTTPTTSTRLNVSQENELSQELLGSSRALEHPIRNFANYASGLTNEVLRNRGAKSVLDFYAQHGSKLGDRFRGLYAVRQVAEPSPTPPPGKDYVSYLEDGKPKWFEVDVEFAAALRAFSPDVTVTTFGKTFEHVRNWAQVLSAAAHLPFIAVQPFKDPVGAVMNVNTKKYNPRALSGMEGAKALGTWFAAVVGNYGKVAARGAGRLAGGRQGGIQAEDAVNSLLDRLPFHREFRDSPAVSSPLATFFTPDEKLGVDLEPGQGLRKRAARGAMKIPQFIQDTFLTPIEEGTKFASYSAARQSGMGPVEATKETRLMGGSPDWNQRGTLMEEGTTVGKLQNWVLFLNPALQGVARMMTAAKQHPASYGKAAMYGGAALASLYGYNSQFVDENGIREYDKIPDDIKMNNFVFILPEWLGDEEASQFPGLDPNIRSTGSVRYTTLKFPMAHELAFVLRPALIAMKLAGDTKGNYSAGQAAVDMVSPLLPGGVSMEVNNPVTVLDKATASLNPLARYPIELMTDRYAFTGAPIVGSRVAENIPEYQNTLRTDPVFAAIGKHLGISGDRIQHFASTFTGGTAEMLAGMARPFVDPPPNAELRTGGEATAQTPLLGPVARRFVDTGIADQVMMDDRNRFYRLLDKADQAASTISSLKGRNPWELQELLQSRPDLLRLDALNSQLTSWRNQLSAWDRTRELVVRSPDLTPVQKQQQLKSLWNAEREFFKAFDQVVAAWGESGLIEP